MTLQGQVKNGVVVIQNGAAQPLPEGTLVEIRPLNYEVQSPSAVPAERPEPVSKERQEALLGLIGMWKVEQPPNDEEVKRIIEEERMKKYG